MDHSLQMLYETLCSRPIKVKNANNSFELIKFIHELTIEDKKKFLSMINDNMLNMIYIYSFEKEYVEICQVIQSILEERNPHIQ